MSHSLALRSDGTVVAWGDDSESQASVPAGLTAAKQVAAGGYHSLVLLNNGTVVGFGSNAEGQIRVPPAAKSGIVSIAAGVYSSLALKADGSIVAWCVPAAKNKPRAP